MAAVIQQIRDRYPDADLVAFTNDPADTQQRHGITAFALRRGGAEGERSRSTPPAPLSWLKVRLKRATQAAPRALAVLRAIATMARRLWGVPGEVGFVAQSLHRLRGTDLLIVAGSNQLNDYFGGSWGFPYDLLKWCLLAKWIGAKVAFLCCGAGPLDSWLGQRLIRFSLVLADSRSYRDAFSWKLIERLGVAGANPVCTDLAYGLRVAAPPNGERATRRLLVGINPFPFFDGRYWPEEDAATYQRYVGKLAAFAEWLNQRGHRVSFFPTQLRADVPVIEDIRTLLDSRGPVSGPDPLGDRPVSSLEDLLGRLARMDIVVATRYHGVLLAAALHRPVLAISYYEKTRDLMAQVGQSAYVVDIHSFDAETLAERFGAMAARRQAIRGEIERGTQVLRQALAREYDRVFGLLEAGSRVAAPEERVVGLARANG